jgi:Flp pilus assembly protein TadD
LGLSLFFVADRYRLPLVLLLMPLAADQAKVFFDRGKAAYRSLLAAAAIALPLNLPNRFTASFAADDAERQILAAHAWRNQGKIHQASVISADLVARYPNDANAQMLRAEMLVNAGKCRDALDPLRRATELAPRAATPWVMLGNCFADLGEPAPAERAYAAALSLHPYHPVALARAAELYESHGRLVEARALYQRFLKAGYDDPDIARRLAALTPVRQGVRTRGP